MALMLIIITDYDNSLHFKKAFIPAKSLPEPTNE